MERDLLLAHEVRVQDRREGARRVADLAGQVRGAYELVVNLGVLDPHRFGDADLGDRLHESLLPLRSVNGVSRHRSSWADGFTLAVSVCRGRQAFHT